MANTLGRRASRTWRRAITSTLAIAVLTGLTGCPDDSLLSALIDDNGTAPETYTVSYDANNATSGTPPAPQTKTQGEPLTLATNSGNLVRTGDTFDGWNTAADGSGTDYAEGATYTADADVTLYANWTPNYQIGDTGPAGGIVFYDKGEYSEGWRYLEAAPENTEWVEKPWDYGVDAYVHGTEVEIGSGPGNTEAIVSVLGNGGEYAAKLCDDLEYGEQDDWFLPSKGELNLMYQNLRLQGLGGFEQTLYWSSSQSSQFEAWAQHFSSGDQSGHPKDYNFRVRAARAF